MAGFGNSKMLAWSSAAVTAVRVIPDMFADVLVANAAYDDRSGGPTSFLDRAQRAASGTALQHLLVNASRIDWQVRDGSPGRADIVEGFGRHCANSS